MAISSIDKKIVTSSHAATCKRKKTADGRGLKRKREN